MKLFGQYLVEKGIISEGELLSALIEQIRKLPSVVEIVHDLKLLSAQQILSALELQTRENIDFPNACRKLGYWNTGIESQIAKEIAAHKIPIGEVLIKSEKVSFQKIVNALDEYLAQTIEKKELPKQTLEVSESVSKEAPINPEFLSRYGELFSEEKVKAIENLFGLALELISKTVPDPGSSEIFKQIHKGFHEVRGMSRFVKASKTEMLITAFENAVSSLLTSEFEKVPQPSLELLIDLGKTTLGMAVGLKESLIKNHTEDMFYSSAQEAFNKTCKDLEDLNQYFQSLKAAPKEELREVA